VIVTIVKPQVGLLPYLSRNSQSVALVAILIAGLGLGVTLAWSRRNKTLHGKDSKKGQRGPLRQATQGNERQQSQLASRRRPDRLPEAYLVRLKDDGQPITSPSIPISTREMTFGSDPIQATRVLDDPSVSPLHARLREENGRYILTDERSTAGTWVNYEQLTAPRRLEHGDVIQIGRFSYRFLLRSAPERAAPRITPTTK
jgi:pSer/pThr/pTyr-binding forkhead associated (FHA) protein